MQRLWIDLQLQELLDESLLEWFHGLAYTAAPGGGTTLSGVIPDYAALHGILERVRDLNLHLVSVQVCEQNQKENE